MTVHRKKREINGNVYEIVIRNGWILTRVDVYKNNVFLYNKSSIITDYHIGFKPERVEKVVQKAVRKREKKMKKHQEVNDALENL